MQKRTLLVLPLLIGLAACDRQPVAPIDGGTPAYNWMNNPYNGNLRITRFEDGFIACWSDATNGLRACHSTFPLGDGTETDCGPQAVLDPIPFQWVGVIDPIDFFASWLRQNARGHRLDHRAGSDPTGRLLRQQARRGGVGHGPKQR